LNLLLDTHLLIWSATASRRLSKEAAKVIGDPDNALWFSAASLWEAAIKCALGRPDFSVDVATLRAGLLANDFREMPVEGRHIIALRDLPLLHRDPFDRLLVAQAKVDALFLVTADSALLQYGDSVRLV
jgi:PIN domain nuclease of toxin-antitoxin system